MPFSDFSEATASIAGQFCETFPEWGEIAALTNEISVLENEIDVYLRHIHRSHLHYWYDVAKHLPHIVDVSESGPSAGHTHVGPTDLLLMELYTQEDLDHNGKVYGRDFIISHMDVDKPRSLCDVETQLQLVHQIVFPLRSPTQVTFAEYLKEVHWEYRPVPINFKAQLAQELITGQKNGGGVHNEIYGHDYIIDPNDPSKPSLLTEIEGEYLKVLPKKIITWDGLLSKKGFKEASSGDIHVISEKCDYVSTRLVGEWLYSYDIDGNGLVYGTHFMIASGDPNKARCLYDIESDIDWSPPNDIAIMSWDEFCKTFPDSNPDDRGDMADE